MQWTLAVNPKDRIKDAGAARSPAGGAQPAPTPPTGAPVASGAGLYEVAELTGRVTGVKGSDYRAINQTINDFLDALRKRCGECDGGAAPTRAADERHALELELVEQRTQRRDFPVDGQIRISDSAVRHADAEPVVADQLVPIRDAVPKSPKARALPVKFEVAHPPRRSDEPWTVPAYLVRHAAGAKGKEP